MLLDQYGKPLNANSQSLPAGFAVGGGQLTRDRAGDNDMLGRVGYIQRPTNPWDSWRLRLLDEDNLHHYTIENLMEIILAISPDVAGALWNLNLFVNPYFWFEYEKEDTQSEAIIDDLLDKIMMYWGGLDVLTAQLVAGLFLYGGALTELILTPGTVMPANIVVQDPSTVRFKKVKDEKSGAYVWAYGQYIRGKFHSMLEDPTILHLGLHPLPGAPAGRSMISPSLFAVIFTFGLIRDLRRVIYNQGYPRLDISIDLKELEQIHAQLKAEESETPNFEEWAQGQMESIMKLYEKLKPGQAYVHASAITVNPHAGSLNTQSLGILNDIFDLLQRQVANGIKSNALLQNFLRSALGDNQAEVLWEVYGEGIGSLQQTVSQSLSHHFNYALRVSGNDNRVWLHFGEINESQAMKRAETRKIQIENVIAQIDADLITVEEGRKELGENTDENKRFRRQGRQAFRSGLHRYHGRPTRFQAPLSAARETDHAEKTNGGI